MGEGKDRRQRLVRLTERGHEALEVSIPKWRKAQDELKNALGDELWNNILREARTLIELGGIACDRTAQAACGIPDRSGRNGPRACVRAAPQCRGLTKVGRAHV